MDVSCFASQIAKAKGILVVAVTQCLRGGVSLGTYAVGVALESNGVIPGGDMTTEAVVTKLAYLFGLTNNMKVPQSIRVERDSLKIQVPRRATSTWFEC